MTKRSQNGSEDSTTNVPKKSLVEPKETLSDKWEDLLALLQEDLPDPEKGDRLFTSGGDGEHEVMFFPLGDEWTKWEWYADGYLRAGEVLVEYAKETSSRKIPPYTV